MAIETNKPIVSTNGKRFCSIQKPKPKQLNKNITGERAKLIILNSNKWANGTTLHYYFFDKKADGTRVEYEDGTKEWKTWVGNEAQKNVVRKAFRIWAKTGMGLKFKEVKKPKRCRNTNCFYGWRWLLVVFRTRYFRRIR